MSPFGRICSIPPMFIGLALYYGGYLFGLWGWGQFLDHDCRRRTRLWGVLNITVSGLCLGIGGSVALFGWWWR